MTDYDKELQIAKKLAYDAGKIMLGYFQDATTGQTVKNDRSLVTKADTEINRHIIEVLSQETPTYSVWGEEESVIVENSPFTWVCDPVDGTMPFAKGLPLSTFSIALVDADGYAVLGIIYDPFQDRLFEAVKGNGAYLNGSKIQVSNKADFDRAYIDLELWINHEEEVTFQNPINELNAKDAWVTITCSAIIMGCFVAQGSYDAMVFGQGKPEDIAALSVIVTEAGGKVTDLFGKPQRYDTNIKGAIVSNGLLHDEICKITSNMNYSSKYL